MVTNQQSHPVIYVIILNWNGKKDTLECLDSFSKVTTPHQILIVDNGSTDDSVHAIKQSFPLITVLETGKNLGYAGGNNVGIQYALEKGADYILILNNDTIVAPEILDRFLDSSDKPILGAKPYLYHDRKRLDHLGGIWNTRKKTFDLVGAGDMGDKWISMLPLDYVCGCALFVKAEVFRNIGLFEPRFFLFWEESDWCFRAKQRGYLAYYCPEAKLWHKVSASFIGGKPHTTYFWWRGRLFWMKRNCSKYDRLKLLPEIFRLVKRYPLKKAQLFLLKMLNSKRDLRVHQQKLFMMRSALTGIKDSIIGRFDNGPSWLFNLEQTPQHAIKNKKDNE